MKLEMFGSILLIGASGVAFLGQQVQLPLGAVIGLAVLPTAELSAVSAAAINNVKRRFKNE